MARLFDKDSLCSMDGQVVRQRESLPSHIMNQDEIFKYIPHRPPFLFVDECTEVTPDRIVTTHRADPRAHYFQGHFPRQPIMPGVLICESCFQAGALLVAKRLGNTASDAGSPVVTRISEAKFKRIVRPGDLLRINVALDEEFGGAFFLNGKVTVGGATALRMKFAVTMTGIERE